MNTQKCIICNSQSIEIKTILSTEMKLSLESYFGDKIYSDLDSVDYQIFKCKHCDIEYANPMISGSKNFYDWITNHQYYYPRERWEWEVVLEYIKINKINSILEIGCGSGDFLEKCNLEGVNCIGLDMTEKSIQISKEKGLNVYCCTIEEYLKLEGVCKCFDLVVSFHTLEHVDDPASYIQDNLKLSDRILVSTPLTTMQRLPFFDPLNYPPHHMTRWRLNSYIALSKRLNLKSRFFISPPPTLFFMLRNNLSYKWNGFNTSILTKREFLNEMLVHPLSLIREFINILFKIKRVRAYTIYNGFEKVIKQREGFFILVELTR
jgi:SAM-dependent methyltransferase